jgi:hypothetical protein
MVAVPQQIKNDVREERRRQLWEAMLAVAPSLVPPVVQMIKSPLSGNVEINFDVNLLASMCLSSAKVLLETHQNECAKLNRALDQAEAEEAARSYLGKPIQSEIDKQVGYVGASGK